MSSRDRAALVGLAVLLIGLSILSDTSARQDVRDLRPSSYLSTPGGAAALFLTLDELGVPVERRLTPWVAADSLSDPLVLLAPSQPPTPQELHALAGWIRDGGTLLYAARPTDPTLDTLGLQLMPLAPDSLSPLRRRRWSGARAHPRPHPLTQGSPAAQGFRFAFDGPARAAAEVLLETEDGAMVAIRVPMGRGWVVAFSDAAPLLNATVGRSGAAPLFTRAAAMAGSRVVFDEYHHGFRAGGSAAGATVRFLRDTRPGNALLQLAIAALGLLLVAGARFGAPLPPPPARRRDPLEHVGALAQAYRRAGARRTARRLLLRGLTRRLGRPLADAEGTRTFDLLRRSLPARTRQRVAALETEWNRDDGADLIALARHMDQILQETRTG